MDTNDLDRKVPRLNKDSPGRQMALLPAKLPDVLIYCGILVRLPFRLLLRLAVVCKAWRHQILGATVRRLREDTPGRQIASPPVQLPDDLIYLGILARLPFRALLRVAVVSKAWHHLILGDPAFARTQAGCPSPASSVLARYHQGRLEILSTGAVASSVAPLDASLSFLPVANAELRFCSTTSGLLCLIENAIGGGASATIFVVNPATRAFRAVPYASDGRFIMPCLAYDPSKVHRNGYHIVVPVKVKEELWRFWSFSSSGGGWRVSGAEVHLAPSDFVVSKPLYLGGRAHWLCEEGGVVWHDASARADSAGALPPPIRGRQGRLGNIVLVAWHGRIGIVSAIAATGLTVWALSSSSLPAHWELVHRRSWDEIPGVDPLASCFQWSVVPAVMEGGGEKALGLAVRIGYTTRRHGVDGASGEEEIVWRRELLRYDVRTGATEKVLVEKRIHEEFGVVFGYQGRAQNFNTTALQILNNWNAGEHNFRSRHETPATGDEEISAGSAATDVLDKESRRGRENHILTLPRWTYECGLLRWRWDSAVAVTRLGLDGSGFRNNVRSDANEETHWSARQALRLNGPVLASEVGCRL